MAACSGLMRHVPRGQLYLPCVCGIGIPVKKSFILDARLPEVLRPVLSRVRVFPLRAPLPCLWRLASPLGCRMFPRQEDRVTPHDATLRTNHS